MSCNTIVNVRNICENLTNDKLKEMFSKYGTVTSCKIMLSGNAEFGRFAYVAFEDPDAAEEAIIELNCQQIGGQRIYLCRTGEKRIRPSKIKKNPESLNVKPVKRAEIFVKGLEASVTAAELRSKFRHCGTITSAKIIMENGRSKGYGFVSFATQEAADKAVTEMKGSLIAGVRIHVALANGTDHTKNSRGFDFSNVTRRTSLGNNPTASTTPATGLQLQQNLNDLLKQINAINPFEDPDAAEEAIIELNCQQIGGQRIYLCRTGEKRIRPSKIKKNPESLNVKPVKRAEIFVKCLDAVTEMKGSFIAGVRIHVALANGTDHSKNSRGFDFSNVTRRTSLGNNPTASTAPATGMQLRQSLNDLLKRINAINRPS